MTAIAQFFDALFRVMTPLEIAGNLFGLISVVLAVRENIWTMPSGIVNVVLFAVLFYQVKLYPDVCLQMIFFVLTAYGWWAWTRRTGPRKVAATTRLSGRMALALLGGGVACYLCLALFFSTYTDASLPWIDSLTTTMSVIAQYLLSKKVLENWYLWIAADLIMIPMYVYKGIGLTAGLYVVFLVLAVRGLMAWRAEMCKETAAWPVGQPGRPGRAA